MEKRVLILYNPKAGKGRIRRKMDAVEEVFFTAGYKPVPKMLRFGENPFDGLEGEYDLVVICGGDGTINYVINAMKTRGLDYTLAIIPAGTANDFAKALGMSIHPVKAARQIIEGEVEKIDCGKVNDLYFINIFSFGMFTTTSQHTPEVLKQHIGKAAYIVEGSKELHNREYIPLHIVYDGGEMDINSVITLIFNGETAGGFPLARNASTRDGLLDLVVLRKCGSVEGFFSVAKYLLNGKDNADVMHITSSKFEITSPLSPLTDMDGQPSAEFPLTVECLPANLKIITPKR